MTKTIICQYTGIAFEGTARQKNHPKISEILNDAAKESYYGIVKDIVVSTRGKFATIEEAVAHIKTVVASRVAAATAEQVRQRQAADDRAERVAVARADRAATNAILRAGGYQWQKTVHDEESMDAFGANAFNQTFGAHRDQVVEWDLWSPDNRLVTVRQAMTELAEIGNDAAARWLAARGDA